jgi:hypothetical protein
MTGSTPAELRSDAWVIRQNALRLLGALRAFLDRFADGHAANRARRVAARTEHGVGSEAVGLTAVDGVGSGRASKLADAGLATPADLRAAGVDGLVDAGLSEGVAERVLEGAAELPDVAVEWGSFPERIGAGDNEMREATVRNDGGAARAAVEVRVNGVEMTADATYLTDAATLPVGVFGAEDPMEFTVRVSFPEVPLPPVEATRTVRVD